MQVLYSKWCAMRRVLAENHPVCTTFCPILHKDGRKNHVVIVNSSKEKKNTFLSTVGGFEEKSTSTVAPRPYH